MKILTVAIPNHHFFQWVNQLEGAGYEVFWFDIRDGGPASKKIEWVTQIKGWKLRWDFPYRTGIKARLPSLYNWIQRWNEHSAKTAFAKAYDSIQPDIVHCFEMELAGFPILPIIKNVSVPFVYSSWGSDLYHFAERGVDVQAVKSFLKRVDYLITDCRRDYKIADDLGFSDTYLGVFPGNGGLSIASNYILNQKDRDYILIKGYEDGVGKASIVLDAIEQLDLILLKGFNILIYSGDQLLVNQIKKSSILSSMAIEFYRRDQFINNEILLEKMGRAVVHIGNSISDGMPNALLEAMAMGAFPIQSNPGGATAEVILHSKNGLLIENPLDATGIAQHLREALTDVILRQDAQRYNVNFVKKNYDRTSLQSRIVRLYQDIFEEN